MLRRFKRELSVFGALAAMLLLLAFFGPGFFKPEQLRAVLVSNAPVLVAAVGMALVIIARHIDISIGSQFCICGVLAGLLAKMGVGMPIVVGCTLAAGGMLGAANGFLIGYLKLPSIVVTLATLVIFREGLRWIREGEFVRNMPEGFQWFGLGQTAGQWVVVGVAVGVFAVVAWGMRHIAAGRAIYATGADAEAARLAGIRPNRVVFWVFVAMGILSGLAAILSAIRFADVDPNAGVGLEMQVIAAVVVGGVAVSGGRGTLVGCLIGVALLGVIGPGLVHLQRPPYWEKAIQGLIILVAVASDAVYERKAGR